MLSLRADLLRWCDASVPHRQARWSWPVVLTALVTEQGAWAVVEYRWRRWARTRSTAIALPLRAVCLVSHKLIEILTGISISSSADIGAGLYIGHFGGIRVAPGVVAGNDLNLSQEVVIGLGRGGVPALGDGVFIGPGAKLFGAIAVGDRSEIGANAVVLGDVPPGTLAAGVPATPRPRRALGAHAATVSSR
jgi:serine O-acetyltransferase